jgi:P27 family predicted phage terminase small subunit
MTAVPGPKPASRNPSATPGKARAKKLSDFDAPEYLQAQKAYDEFNCEQVATEIWNDLAPELDRLGILSVLDTRLLARYCECYARWLHCRAWIQERGSSFPTYTYREEQTVDHLGNVKKIAQKRTLKNMIPYPQVAMYDRLLTQLGRMEDDLGLTPQSRARILNSLPPPNKLEANGGQEPPKGTTNPFNYAAAKNGLAVVR